VHAAYTRAARIVRGRDGVVGVVDVDAHLFAHDAERALWSALRRAEEEILPDATVDRLVRCFRPLTGPIDQFFREVHVMADDDRLRGNRLALLRRVAGLADGIADLTKLRGA
jgi:glycyl-tRNA synthetase beta subunit